MKWKQMERKKKAKKFNLKSQNNEILKKRAFLINLPYWVYLRRRWDPPTRWKTQSSAAPSQWPPHSAGIGSHSAVLALQDPWWIRLMSTSLGQYFWKKQNRKKLRFEGKVYLSHMTQELLVCRPAFAVCSELIELPRYSNKFLLLLHWAVSNPKLGQFRSI